MAGLDASSVSRWLISLESTFIKSSIVNTSSAWIFRRPMLSLIFKGHFLRMSSQMTYKLSVMFAPMLCRALEWPSNLALKFSMLIEVSDGISRSKRAWSFAWIKLFFLPYVFFRRSTASL